MRPPTPPSTCDLLVIAAGPAGLAAAVYGASDGLSVYLCDSLATGGQAATSARIENYLGFPASISGSELAERALLEVRKFGAILGIPATIAAVTPEDGRFRALFADGRELSADAVVVATDVQYRRLSTTGLDRFEASNVFYAASAGQAALFLARTGAGVDRTPGMSTRVGGRVDRRSSKLC